MITGVTKATKFIKTDADRIVDGFVNLIANKTARVGAPPFNGGTDSLNLLYGLANGAVNVFPLVSLPQLCRGNVT